MIHIEGLGWFGSVLARRLASAGHDFSWSDNDDPHSAWPASTGLAYPDGDKDNRAGLDLWQAALPDVAEASPAPYVFAHKTNPHGGEHDGIARDYGPVRRSGRDAVAVNVPAYVRHTRALFAGARLDHTPTDAAVVVAHSTDETRAGYLWGWAAKVRLELPRWLDGLEWPPALYAKAHRYNLTYAYPIPGTGLHWAGSVLQFQRRPATADPDRLARLYEQWTRHASALLHIAPADTVEIVQGWRPRPIQGSSKWATRRGDRWTLPTMATDGIRRGPLVVEDLARRAGW